MTNIFDNVKVGDLVTILSDRGEPRKTTKVTKVLKYYFVADYIHFGFSGFQKGGTWNRTRCTPWKQEHTDYIKLSNARHELKNIFNEEIYFLTIEEIDKIKKELTLSEHRQDEIRKLTEGL